MQSRRIKRRSLLLRLRAEVYRAQQAVQSSRSADVQAAQQEKVAAAEAKVTAAHTRLTTALASGTATEKVRARTALERAQAGLVAAKNADAQAVAERRLAAAQAALNRNISNRVSTQSNLNSVTSVGTRLMSGALGLIGGVPGLVMLGAGAGMRCIRIRSRLGVLLRNMPVKSMRYEKKLPACLCLKQTIIGEDCWCSGRAKSSDTRCAGVIYGGAVWVPGETSLVCLRVKPLSTWRVR